MAAPQPDINTILRMLGDAQRQPATASSAQGHPGALQHMPPQGAGYPASYGAPGPAPNYPFPQPAVSGSYDLNAMRGGNPGQGQGSVADAIARAKAYATEKGFTPYERPPGASYPPSADPYAIRDSDGNQPGYGRSRSRSPGPRRGDPYRDNVNPYRDERRAADYPARDNYGRDRSQSPGPRSAGGRFSPRNGPRERSPMRKEENSELMDIEANLVGLVIGRQGENLRRVEGETGCRVQFISPATPNNNEPFRQCRITGPRPAREQAREMISQIVSESSSRGGGPRPPPGGGEFSRGRGGPGGPRGGPGGGPGGGMPGGGPGGPGGMPGGGYDGGVSVPALKEGESNLPIMVPDRTVGLIIGRGGETIRDLQEKSGCHINIVGEDKSVNGLRPVNLIGTPAASRMAKDLILEIVDSDARNGGAGQAPPNVAPYNGGGRGGGGGGGGGGRSYHDGPAGGGGGGGGGYDSKMNDSIYVPSEAVGMIIGKGGETIREIQAMTGCKINVSQPSGPAETEREIGLVGSQDSIERAKEAIEEKVNIVRQKGSGPPRGRGQHRDWDNPNYGQLGAGRGGGGGGGGGHSNHMQAQQHATQQPTASAAAGAAGVPAAAGGDPYAPWGGYENYCRLYYQSMYQQAQSSEGGAAQPPGMS